jgi:YihY family inner membrane protein
MVVLGFFVFATLISTASLPYFQNFLTLNFIRKFSNIIVPLVFWILLNNIAYYFIPNTRLKHHTIWISTSFTAVIWILLKLLFDYAIEHFTNMKQVYGIISSFPIFLFWIYINWIVVLSGVIIMAILNPKKKKSNKYRLTAQIQLEINEKGTHDFSTKIDFSEDEESQFRKLLADILKKK